MNEALTSLARDPLGLLFLDTVVKATMLLLLACLVTTLLRRRVSAAVRHRVWCLAFGGLLLLPVLSSLLPGWRVPILPEIEDTAAVAASDASNAQPVTPKNDTEAARLNSLGQSPAGGAVGPPSRSIEQAFRNGPSTQYDPAHSPTAPIKPTTHNELVGQPPTATEVAQQPPTAAASAVAVKPDGLARHRHWRLWLGALWFLGVLAAVLPVVTGLIRNRFLGRDATPVEEGEPADRLSDLCRNLGLRRRVRLLETGKSLVPMTWGVLWPIVLFPISWRQWTSQKRRLVLLHELAHVKRCDVAFQLLARISCAVYWFHPLAWYGLRRLRIERELACDDCVLMAGERPSEYAQQLVELARTYRMRPMPAAVAIVQTTRLEQRVRAVLDRARSHLPLSRTIGGILVLCAALVVTGMAAVRPSTNEQPQIDRTEVAGEPASKIGSSEDKTAVSGPEVASNEARKSDGDREATAVVTGESAEDDAGLRYEGTVVDPDGKPVPGAMVRVVRTRNPNRHRSRHESLLLAEVKTDNAGRFKCPVKQSQLPIQSDDENRPDSDWIDLIAIKAGYGFAYGRSLGIEPKVASGTESSPRRLSWTKHIDRPNSNVLTLVADDVPIHGRIIDIEGRPVGGALVKPTDIWIGKDGTLDAWQASANESDEKFGMAIRRFAVARSKLELAVNDRFAENLPSFVVQPATTDADGRFTLRGVGRERFVEVIVSASGMETTPLYVRTERGEIVTLRGSKARAEMDEPVYPAEFIRVLGPSIPFVGQVTNQETGEPVPDCVLRPYLLPNYYVNEHARMKQLSAHTDGEGRFRLEGLPLGRSLIAVSPPRGSSYLAGGTRLKLVAGKESVKRNVQLTKGILVRGRVVDRRTGQPVSGSVDYFAFPTNPFYKKAANIQSEHQDLAIRTDEDGRFKIPALPGKGIIAFSSDDWTAYPVGVGADEIDAPKLQDSSTLIFDTKPSSCVTRSFHALAAIDPQPDMSELTVDFSLVAGASVSGSVVDSKGNPIHDYYVRGQFDQSGWTKVKGETFEVKHYFVSERRRLMFFEPTRNLVGLYHLTGEPPETLRITLQPGGTIKGRIVDEAGLPIANLEFDNHQFAIKNEHYGDLLTWRDRKLLKTDQDGRFVFPGIIPGLKYSANVSGVKKVPGFTQPVMMRLGTAFTDITVEVGQTKDMGELTYNGKQEFVSKHRSIGKAKASSDGNSGPEQEPQSSAPKRKSDDDRMVVTGRVVDPDGKPISNAQIAVVGRRNSLFREPKPFGQTKTDVTGRYRLRMPRTSSSSFLKVSVFASSPGFGIGWQPLNLNADQPEVLIELPPEQIIRGRLINLEGQPASGVKVYVTQIGKPVPGGRTLWSMWFSEPVDDLSAWPGPITTDERGRFVLRGIGRKLAVNLQTRDEPFARESIHIRADDTTEIREISMALAPAQIIEGTVVSEKTGKPVPNARLNVTVGFDAKNKYAGSAISGRANENGYFRLNPYPGKSYVIAAFAPAGRAELNLQRELKWPVGSPQQRVEMRLPSGVLVRGRVTEAETGRPIAGAGIEYRPRRFGNSNLRDDVITGWQARTTSGKDGVFRIAVLPGPGHLLINGPTPDYIHQEVGARTIDGDQPGGQRIYAHAVHRLDLQLDAKVHTLDVSLRRGVTIKGRLVDPDGKPVKEAKMLWRYPMLASEHRFRGLPTTIRDGQFELHGLDPNETYPVVFLDPENELGAAVELSGRSDARRSLVVPMVPCGSATTRFIDPDGKPIAQYAPSLLIVITPGPGRVSLKEKDRSRLSADEGFVGNFDRRHYWNPPQTDEQGQCTFPALVPGAAYRFDVSRDGQLTVTKTFKVESGKTLQLPDVVTARE